MIGFFCDTLVFERSSKAFFSFAFSVRSFFIRDEKKFARREKTQDKTFFTFFVSLFFSCEKAKKNFYFPPQTGREKRDIKTENTKAQEKRCPFPPPPLPPPREKRCSDSSRGRPSFFLTLLLAGEQREQMGCFLRTTTRRDF